MRSRVALGFLIAVVGCIAFTASASACPVAHLVLSPDAARQGDTVSWSLSGIVKGTTYSISVAGQEINGTNETDFDGVSGTFTMPDLGSQQMTVTAHGTCTCPEDAQAQLIEDSMEYLPLPPAAPSPSGSTLGSDSAPAPAAAVQTAQKPKGSATRHRPSAAPSHAAVPSAQRPTADPEVGAEVAAPQAATSPSASAPDAQPRSKARSAESSSSVPGRVLDTIGGTTSVGPAKVPTLGLLALALVVISGLGLAGLAIYIFRNGPDPDAAVRDPAPPGPDPVEEELQQMIADEMARQLITDLNLGEAEKVSAK